MLTAKSTFCLMASETGTCEWFGVSLWYPRGSFSVHPVSPLWVTVHQFPSALCLLPAYRASYDSSPCLYFLAVVSPAVPNFCLALILIWSTFFFPLEHIGMCCSLGGLLVEGPAIPVSLHTSALPFTPPHVNLPHFSPKSLHLNSYFGGRPMYWHGISWRKWTQWA